MFVHTMERDGRGGFDADTINVSDPDWRKSHKPQLGQLNISAIELAMQLGTEVKIGCVTAETLPIRTI